MGGLSSTHRQRLIFSGVVLLGLPGIVLFLSGIGPHPLTATCVYGGAILAGAFVLSWAAEVAELDISASLAIAILALLTVLPEYAIEAVLAWDAGASFDTATQAATGETRRVAANVTGANRLLIGFGWPVVILIQWIAPLASELPEVTVAVLFALRGNAAAGITVLIASEVNKFTLLIGSMVVIFSLSAGEMLTFPLDTRQTVEFLLTAAVALFGLVLIARRTLDWRAGVVLLGLFVAHLFFPRAEQRLWFTYAYLGLAGVLIVLDWRRVTFLFRVGD